MIQQTTFTFYFVCVAGDLTMPALPDPAECNAATACADPAMQQQQPPGVQSILSSTADR